MQARAMGKANCNARDLCYCGWYPLAPVWQCDLICMTCRHACACVRHGCEPGSLMQAPICDCLACSHVQWAKPFSHSDDRSC